MAATDKNYRDQYRLDIVFAISSILMLVSVIWMFVEDHYREYKPEQRGFRDVEAAVAQRMALEQIPGREEFDQAEKAVLEARSERDVNKSQIESLRDEIGEILPKKEESEFKYQSVKADLESRVSFLNIEVDKHGPQSELAKRYGAEIKELESELDKVQQMRDGYFSRIKEKQRELDKLEAPLTKALGNLKKLNDKFDTQVKSALAKEWGWGDWFRALPVIDGFASPLKIHQYTINDIPIDYNFKYVTRFDRCMTCHQGIDRPAYTKEALRDLTRVTDDQAAKLQSARNRLAKRKDALRGLKDAGSVPGPDQMNLDTVDPAFLNESRIQEFCVHPRLDLFVGPNSRHPAERFGCSACHSGQGSGTGFVLASHTPNDSKTKERWVEQYGWHYDPHKGNALWDFPMLPMRFIESSCIKCHHQVTDLIGSDNRNEAPKVTRGFNLIKEFGCFGCHEIAGRKGGKQIGPDLRLEPSPPLEDLLPDERAKLESDPDNLPGTLRKVGPSLVRVAEKTNRAWTARWLASPRGFRPDTKMPHFYGLSNNNEQALAGTGQEKFPNAEIQSIVQFLFDVSEGQLRDHGRARTLESKATLKDDEKKELGQLKSRLGPRRLKPLVDQAAGYKGDPIKGRQLFSERGCLACHSHQGTEAAQVPPQPPQIKDKEGAVIANPLYTPKVVGEANFGPSLSQLVEKLGAKAGDRESARIWLMQWIMEPQFHSPRSRMPVTHLTVPEAADLAAWLLSQKAQDLGEEWATTEVPEPDVKTLQDLVNVYLVRLLSKDDMASFAAGTLEAATVRELPAEEQALHGKFKDPVSLKFYVGKKAVGRLGCYACHDIPGFDNAKPIGVALNDWGRKAPDRLAFEDIKSFFQKHYFEVDRLVDKAGKPHGKNANGQEPYEKFYSESLFHHGREGYLNQKVRDPRSYDHNRLRTWDDRARMPQFRFAKSRKKDDESKEDHAARQSRDEAEAREAVATFVLGLVAEQIPTVSLPQPKPDRLAEIKGRQVLDKFNCAGCHLVRPGLFEFRFNPEMRGLLEKKHATLAKDAGRKGDHVFPEHALWSGANPLFPDRLRAFGVLSPLGQKPKLGEDDDGNKVFEMRLTHALRFEGADKSMKDIGAATNLQIPPRNMAFPPEATVTDPNKMEAFLVDHGPFGGAFADLLTKYLMAKDGTFYKKDRDEPDSDSGVARSAVPPGLIGQGERTQSGWLYQFLLNPQPIRKMTVLRMPKFNMSKEEAQTLVDYFAAVEKAANAGVGLTFPFESIPQQSDLDSDFWRSKTAAYVTRLRSSWPTVKDKDGKEVKSGDKTWYQLRLEEFNPIWKQVHKDSQEQLKIAQEKLSAAAAEAKTAKAAADAEKDKDKKPALDKLATSLEQTRAAWEAEVKTWDARVAQSAPDAQQKTWELKEAYVTDAFRLMMNKDLCSKCHMVAPGAVVTNPLQGPPLITAYDRLRPGWLERWVAVPTRFLHYPSQMPLYFPADNDSEFNNLLAGTSRDRATATRDALMNYPQASALPTSRYFLLPLPGENKGDKK